MFRLIKLGLYAVLGYALYELYLGMTEQSGPQGGGGQRRGGQRRGGQQRGRAGGQNITGRGEGMEIKSEEPSGTSTRHKVGRGVVS